MNTKDEQIEKVKHELMDRYIILMIIILGIYASIFTFYIHDKIMPWYLIGGLVFISYSYSLMRKRFPLNTIVHLYLIIAPLYNFYVMLSFWNNSVASFCWLLPIPLGAYIFFTKKEVLVYSLYTLLIVVIGYLVANNFTFYFPKHSQKEVMFTDTLLFASNILIVTLLIYYKDKIRKQEILLHFRKTEIIIQKDKKIDSENVSEDADIDVESMEKLFSRIETCMCENLLFKDIKFNLSALSVALNVNSSYISKAIRYKGYPNFNSYLNIYRINCVKKLFTEVDFQKTTLMYVYTEAGFSNQSTFNRVFKQIEGTTPSEYFQRNLKNNTESSI
jgi:AraC-like DNA-binding protein